METNTLPVHALRKRAQGIHSPMRSSKSLGPMGSVTRLLRKMRELAHTAWQTKSALSVEDGARNHRTSRRVRLTGGDGRTADRPIVVDAAGSPAGVEAQYRYLSSRFGRMDHDWVVARRVHQTNARGRIVEKFVIAFAEGSNEVIHFDITAYYGRF